MISLVFWILLFGEFGCWFVGSWVCSKWDLGGGRKKGGKERGDRRNKGGLLVLVWGASRGLLRGGVGRELWDRRKKKAMGWR